MQHASPAAGANVVVVGHVNVKDDLLLCGVELRRLDLLVIFGLRWGAVGTGLSRGGQWWKEPFLLKEPWGVCVLCTGAV